MSSCFYYPGFFFLFLSSFLSSFMASAQSPASSPRLGHYVAIIIAVSAPNGVVVLLFIIDFIAIRTRMRFDTTPTIDGDDVTIEDSLLLDFRIIQAVAHNFSESNKGTLFNGFDIAVKRLSKSSGLSEVGFKNEVVLVAKLQHRNLVRLLGFCLEGNERVLVYECLPNKSLDFFLFDPTKKSQLDWTLRHKIIEGIVRAMLYRHQDSLLTVIHCDLKSEDKSREFEPDSWNLAWMLLRNGTPLHLVDPAIGYNNYQRSEVIRCIQVGLLCVQEDHEHRPMFSTVVMMLTSNTINLLEPRKSPLKSKSYEPLLSSVDDDASITNLYPG